MDIDIVIFMVKNIKLTTKSFSLIESSANLIRVVSEPNRLKILYILSRSNICVCKLGDKIGIHQNLVSHHLKVMQEAGILNKTRKGNKLFYCIKPKMERKVTKLLELINII